MADDGAASYDDEDYYYDEPEVDAVEADETDSCVKPATLAAPAEHVPAGTEEPLVSAADERKVSADILVGDLEGLSESDSVRTISLSRLYALLYEQVAQVADVCGLSFAAGLLLLRKYCFNRSVAEETYFNNPSAALQALELSEACARHQNTFLDATAAAPGDVLVCPICAVEEGEEPDNGLVALSSCRHFFCTGCWRDYVEQRLRSGSTIAALHCMATDCGEVVDVRTLMTLLEKLPDAAPAGAVGHPSAAAGPTDRLPIAQRVRRSLLAEYLETNSRLSWCTNPQRCEAVLLCPSALAAASTVTCPDCGYAMCFRCKTAAHDPASCADAVRWAARLQDNGANIGYVLKHTKACPQCHSRIEKNQGCNHMTCKCGYEFCWICMNNWKSHSNEHYVCRHVGSPDTAPRRGEGGVGDSTERQHKVFFAFYVGYDAHLASLRAEEALLHRLRADSVGIVQLQQSRFGASVTDVQLLKCLSAVSAALLRARRMLAWSYVREYFYATRIPQPTDSAQPIHRESGDSSGNDGGGATPMSKEEARLCYWRNILLLATEDLSGALGSFTAARTNKIDIAVVMQRCVLVDRLAPSLDL